MKPTEQDTTQEQLAGEKPATPVDDLIGIVVAFTIIAAVALAFVQPWAPSYVAGGGLLNRYNPVHDGASALLVQYDKAGKVTAWQSQNIAILAKTRALGGQLRQGPRDSIWHHFGQRNPAEASTSVDVLAQLANVDILETRTNSLDAAGVLTTSSSISVRDPRGEFLISLYPPNPSSPELVFQPPLQSLPSNLRQGSTWVTTGTVSSNVQYQFQGIVADIGPFSNTAGRYDDCAQVDTALTLNSGQQTLYNQRSSSWYCSGIGLVEQHDLDDKNGVTARLVLASGNPGLPPASQARKANEDQEFLGEPSAWRFTRVARLGQEIAAGSSTIPPAWIPSNPPLVLAAGYNGDLTAFDGDDPTGAIVWQFHTQGTIYSPPGYDALRNRIYFGSSDKHLYALDARGLYLWSFETGDNIASRPVVVSDTVVFGSEDRNIYGLDANTGALRWKVKTGGAVVSSPARFPSPAYGGGVRGEGRVLVVIGSDDGGVYALDAATGEQQWLYTTGDAIEAPITVADGVIYAASRDRALYALDSLSGDLLWSADAGEVLRDAPAVSPGAVYVVDDAYRLQAFDRQDGKQLWQTSLGQYVGTPILAGQTLLIAGHDGNVYRFGLDGQAQGEWSVAGATIPTDGEPKHALGPAVGGGALWLADEQAVLRRLGPALAGPTPLALAWAKLNTNAPFEAYFNSSVAEYHGQALAVVTSGQIHLLETSTGNVTTLGQVGAPNANVFAEPVISADTMLVPIADTLFATHLPDGKPLWQFKADGTGFQPVTVAGSTVLWLTQSSLTSQTAATAPAVLTGTLHAIDLNTGKVRWQQAISGFKSIGNATVDATRNVVYISTPPAAFDLTSGRWLWQSHIPGLAMGGVALNDQHDKLYVGLYDPATDIGSIAALNTIDGSVSWHADLGHDALASLDRLWLDGKRLIVPTLAGKVIALDAASGAQRWLYQPAPARFGDITVSTVPGGNASRVWLALQNGTILVLDAATGKPVARFSDITLSLSSYNLTQRPVIIGDKVIAALGVRLYALNNPAH